MAITISDMTTREHIHKLVEDLTDPQLERLMDFLDAQDRPGDIIDEWGNLSAISRASTRRTMRRLYEEERAAGHKPW